MLGTEDQDRHDKYQTLHHNFTEILFLNTRLNFDLNHVIVALVVSVITILMEGESPTWVTLPFLSSIIICHIHGNS